MVKPSKLVIALLAVVLADALARSGRVVAGRRELTRLLSAGLAGRAAAFLLGLAALGAVSFLIVRAARERGRLPARRRDETAVRASRSTFGVANRGGRLAGSAGDGIPAPRSSERERRVGGPAG